MKILLVDDHPIFLEGLQNLLLARGMHVIGTATSGKEALEKVSQLLPDVVLMDVRMKPMSGLQATRLIKARFPDVKIIMLTASEMEEDLFLAIKSGASGYLLKSLNANVLYEILVEFEHGKIPVSPGLATRLLQEFKKNDNAYMLDNLTIDEENEDKFKRLSLRQKEVLVLVANGVKYREIAAGLGVSERTVKYYMEIILHKLNVQNRSQAIKYVIQEGIVD